MVLSDTLHYTIRDIKSNAGIRLPQNERMDLQKKERFLEIGACLAVSLYLTLTMVAVISTVSPFLNRLASHGKTRTNQEEQKLATKSFLYKLSEHPIFMISKARFSDFYSIGIVWTTFCLWNQPKGIFLTLFYIHLTRRFLECNFVHIWNGKMHIAGYALGLLHYVLLPFIFHSQADEGPFTIFTIIGVGMNIYGQYHQFRHHQILASYRSNTRIGLKYTMPNGRWFKYVSCPHYLAEILIYASFASLLHPIVLSEEISTFNIAGIRIAFFGMNLKHYRHLILFFWVLVNLSVSAKSSHQWYKKTFTSYPKDRCALIPYIW